MPSSPPDILPTVTEPRWVFRSGWRSHSSAYSLSSFSSFGWGALLNRGGTKNGTSPELWKFKDKNMQMHFIPHSNGNVIRDMPDKENVIFKYIYLLYLFYIFFILFIYLLCLFTDVTHFTLLIIYYIYLVRFNLIYLLMFIHIFLQINDYICI